MSTRPRLIAFLGWLAVFATGCAVGAYKKPKATEPEPGPEPTPPPEVPKTPRKRNRLSLAVDVDDERLYPAVQKAAAAWNEAFERDGKINDNGPWVTVNANGHVPVFWVEGVEGSGCTPKDKIPVGSYQSGCAVAVGTNDAHIEMDERIPTDERLVGTLIHEIGHMLRSAGGHIDDGKTTYPFNKENIMNHTGDPSKFKSPSGDDVAFVWEGMHYDYTQNQPSETSGADGITDEPMAF